MESSARKNFEKLVPGKAFGRYTLLEPLGKGGMAVVWAARLPSAMGITRTVAIKTLLPELARDEERRRMLVDEGRIAAQLRHPNVCTVEECAEENGVVFLVMDWNDGATLTEIIRAQGKPRAFEPAIALHIVSATCAGLHAAHELKDENGNSLEVVHRDVSPHNILISRAGDIRVSDFGVAKSVGRMQRETAAGTVKGKLSYLPPEYLRDGTIDRRTDIFALGVVSYVLLTGVRPFEASDDRGIVQRILAGTFKKPREVNADIPEEVQGIILKAMALDPSHRYQTAEAMREAIEEVRPKLGKVVLDSTIAALVEERLGAVIRERNKIVQEEAAIADARSSGTSPAQAQAASSESTPSASNLVEDVVGEEDTSEMAAEGGDLRRADAGRMIVIGDAVAGEKSRLLQTPPLALAQRRNQRLIVLVVMILVLGVVAVLVISAMSH